MAEGRRIEAGGLAFNVIVEGDGPPVVLLHGFPDTHAVWRHQIPALAGAGFRVIAPDLRGRGASDAPASVEDYRLNLLVDDVRGIMQGLGVERAHVVGHDWGAALAWMFATFEPARVERLAVLSVGRPGTARRPAGALKRLWYMFMFQFSGVAEEALQRHDWALFREWAADAPDLERYIADLSRPGALTAGLNWYRANVPPQILLADGFDLPPIAVPTLGVWSVRDLALTEEQMTESGKQMSAEWRYERFDCGHFIPVEEPERLSALLVEFLST